MLLTPSSTFTHADWERLIDDDFKEFGKSGQVHRKADAIQYLLSARTDGYSIVHFDALPLGADVVLVTYTLLSGNTPHSNRSSIWRRSATGWRIVYHQGTRIA